VELLEVETLLLGEDLPTIEEVIRRPAWMADALCREYPDLHWFPERGQDTRTAKAVCARCLVRADCADYVATFDALTAAHGIWAGTSARERRQERRAA
jgi:WhiB family redox-sensing transcriptional regulator